MRSISGEKFDQMLEFMQSEEIDAILISDSETSRDVNLKYFSGHPTDGTYILLNNGENALAPWDLLLAKDHAQVDELIDVTQFQFSLAKALDDFIQRKINKTNPVIGVLPNTPYGSVLNLQEKIPDCKIYKHPRKIDRQIFELRATKTAYELDRLVEVCKMSDEVLKDIIHFAKNATDETENDLDLLVLKRLKELGAEGYSFPTLIANTDRSHTLHCHPFTTNAPFAKQGLTIIDFGLKFNGYCSDTTQPFAFGELSEKQQHMIDTAQKVYETAIESIDIGVPIHKIAGAASDVLKEAGYPMNYALGHGIGLTEHDSPFLSSKPKDPARLKFWKEILIEDGMVFTIEPGAYVRGEGGYRIENDVMIRNGKVEVLTSAKFLHIT